MLILGRLSRKSDALTWYLEHGEEYLDFHIPFPFPSSRFSLLCPSIPRDVLSQISSSLNRDPIHSPGHPTFYPPTPRTLPSSLLEPFAPVPPSHLTYPHVRISPSLGRWKYAASFSSSPCRRPLLGRAAGFGRFEQ